MKKRNKKKGFTLIELVIVIAIIAILAAIAIPRYQKSKNKAKEVAIKSNVSMLSSAAVLRQSDMGNIDSVEWRKDKDNYKEYVEQWPKGEAGKEYVVTITPNNIKITLGDEIYNSESGTKDDTIAKIAGTKDPSGTDSK